MIYLHIPFSYFFHMLCSSINAGCRGGAPASPSLHSTAERGERGGAAAAPAGRKLPQEARAARSWGEAKICFEPNVSMSRKVQAN